MSILYLGSMVVTGQSYLPRNEAVNWEFNNFSILQRCHVSLIFWLACWSLLHPSTPRPPVQKKKSFNWFAILVGWFFMTIGCWMNFQEGFGRYLDLHELFNDYINSKFGEQIEYTAYLDVFSQLHKIPKKMKFTRWNT